MQLLSPPAILVIAGDSLNIYNNNVAPTENHLEVSLAYSGVYEHLQELTEGALADIKTKVAALSGKSTSEVHYPYFIIGAGSTEDPYRISYSSHLLE